MAKITLPQVRKRVKALAAERPNFVYIEPDEVYSCVYFHEGAPSCIVGHALADELRAAGVSEDSSHNKDTIDKVVDILGLDITPKAVDYLRDVQKLQDQRVAWGKAAQRAESRA